MWQRELNLTYDFLTVVFGILILSDLFYRLVENEGGRDELKLILHFLQKLPKQQFL